MCRFFSFVSDGRGKVFYFNAEQRRTLVLSQHQGFDSHTTIAEHFKPNKTGPGQAPDDVVNRYEYVNGEFVVDSRVIGNDSKQVRKWCDEFVKSEEFQQICLATIKDDVCAIRYIPNPSVDVQLAAVQQNSWAIKYIPNASVDVQLAAVQQNGYAIDYIKNPSVDVQLAAVQQDGRAIDYIPNPSVKVQLAAVQQDGRAIVYIPNASVKVQLAAVPLIGDSYLAIRNFFVSVKNFFRK